MRVTPRRLRRTVGVLGTLLALSFVLSLAGCGSPDAPPATRSPAVPGSATAGPAASGPVPSASTPGSGGLPRPDHVVVVIFENKDESQVVGSSSAPYLTGLAKSGAAFDDSHGVAHPSQPNYLALFSGSTHGVTSDQCPQHLGAQPNLAQQLLDAGNTFAGYSEALPSVGYTGCSASGGSYRRKHNPWVDFSNVPSKLNRPFRDFPTDLSTLPTVAFVIPDMCNDMHDCSVSTGDTWAREHLSRYVAWAQDHHSLLIVTFDEDSGTSANRIPTILIGPMVRPGTYGQRIDHYAILRTVEQMYALAPLGHAADAAPLSCWRQ